MRSYLNGDYWGTGAYLTATDGRFRDANGIGDAAVYKQETKMQTDLECRWPADSLGEGRGRRRRLHRHLAVHQRDRRVLDTLGFELSSGRRWTFLPW